MSRSNFGFQRSNFDEFNSGDGTLNDKFEERDMDMFRDRNENRFDRGDEPFRARRDDRQFESWNQDRLFVVDEGRKGYGRYDNKARGQQSEINTERDLREFYERKFAPRDEQFRKYDERNATMNNRYDNSRRQPMVPDIRTNRFTIRNYSVSPTRARRQFDNMGDGRYKVERRNGNREADANRFRSRVDDRMFGGYGSDNAVVKQRAPKDWILERRDDIILFSECEEKRLNNIDISCDQIPVVRNVQNPMRCTTWEQMNLHDSILLNVQNMRFAPPRPIQQTVIPLVSSGIDLIVQGDNGSGKTAAYGMPIVNNVLKVLRERRARPLSPLCIILAPVRELATQIYEDLRLYSHGTACRIALSYGQMNIEANINQLRRGCEILVGTPGRIYQYIEEGFIYLRDLQMFVLDEADRHLDYMKWNYTHIQKIIELEEFQQTNKRRQTVLVSNTFPESIKHLVKNIINNDNVARVIQPHRFYINSKTYLKFISYDVDKKFKSLMALLEEILKGADKKVLLFVAERMESDFLALRLISEGVKAESINGDRPQDVREHTMNKFKVGKLQVLVGTDVCSRGLDIKNLDHVINYAMPPDIETLVNRIGRTGRLHKGIVYSFLNPDDALCNEVKELLRVNKLEVPRYLRSSDIYEEKNSSLNAAQNRSGSFIYEQQRFVEKSNLDSTGQAHLSCDESSESNIQRNYSSKRDIDDTNRIYQRIQNKENENAEREMGGRTMFSESQNNRTAESITNNYNSGNNQSGQKRFGETQVVNRRFDEPTNSSRDSVISGNDKRWPERFDQSCSVRKFDVTSVPNSPVFDIQWPKPNVQSPFGRINDREENNKENQPRRNTDRFNY